jgi:signal transduction histidine kinase
MARVRRNLQRLLDMQYEIGDMLREQEYRAHGMLSFLLEASRDMLVTLIESEPDMCVAPEVIQKAIDREFGYTDIPCSEIYLHQMVPEQLWILKTRIAHRQVQIKTVLEPVAPVLIPAEVMEKIIVGLVKNAIENTPDQGRVTVVVRNGEKGSIFEVQDTGVGITAQKQRLIFNHYFAPGDILTYASKSPYDFNAGGSGVDMLRITIFSERYRFGTKMISRRCRYLPSDSDLCPGAIGACVHCSAPEDCEVSGGTTMQIRFEPIKPDEPFMPKRACNESRKNE